jgi:hypothetical protein
MSWRANAGVLSAGLVLSGLLLGPAAQAAAPGQAAAPVQLTGTHLHAALLPASYFPSGYKVEKIENYSSGSKLEHKPAKYHLATFSCQRYLLNSLPATGFGETATAGDVISRAGKQAYNQVVFQFATDAQATTFYRQFYAFTGRCRTVTASFNGGKVKLATTFIKKKKIGRYQAFRALQTVTATGFNTTVNDTTTVLAGTDVYYLDAAGSTVPTKPAVPAALLHLIARVQAAR